MLESRRSHRWMALAIVATLGTGLAACKKPTSAPAADDTAKIAEDAFIYGFPIVMNYGVIYESNIDTTSSQYKGPFNNLVNMSRLLTPVDTSVVTPNSDTPYGFAQVDLRAEPMVVCVPAIPKERYYAVQLIDMNTFNYGYIGTRTTGSDAGCYMIAGPGWKGEMPHGIKKIFNDETQFGLALFRTQLFNAADMDNVRKIQAGYKIQPLSAFLGTKAPPAAPPIDWPTMDKEKVKTGFFNYLAFLLQFIPAQPDDSALRARMATIGIEPGKPFDIAKLTDTQRTSVLAGMKSANEKIDADAKANGDQINGWGIAKIENNRAFIAGNWLRRASIARAGIFANDYQEAMYPMARVDSTGATLDGSKASYTITFPAGSLPPVNAFWSVTMYDARTQLLVANPIERYLINSPMLPKLNKNADGSLTIYVSKNSPGKDKESNWLPAPDGEIYMVMRLYWPKLDQLANWKPPAVIKTP
jgi:hypothetical protein